MSVIFSDDQYELFRKRIKELITENRQLREEVESLENSVEFYSDMLDMYMEDAYED